MDALQDARIDSKQFSQPLAVAFGRRIWTDCKKGSVLAVVEAVVSIVELRIAGSRSCTVVRWCSLGHERKPTAPPVMMLQKFFEPGLRITLAAAEFKSQNDDAIKSDLRLLRS